MFHSHPTFRISVVSYGASQARGQHLLTPHWKEVLAAEQEKSVLREAVP